jgi:hypothetical protein
MLLGVRCAVGCLRRRTDRCAGADRAARRPGEARRLARSVTSISATVSPGRLPLEQSNTGHACSSGTLLHIRIIGTFNTAVAPTAGAPGTPAADSTVSAEEVTADGRSGDVCLVAVRVGPVAPEPGAAVLQG